jgi:hypothetical protein
MGGAALSHSSTLGIMGCISISTLTYISIDFGKLWQLKKEKTHFQMLTKIFSLCFQMG